MDKKRWAIGPPNTFATRKIYFGFPILNMPVPHFGQVPLTAGFPFFSFTSFGSFIILFALHFTQYASTLFMRFLLFGLIIFITFFSQA